MGAQESVLTKQFKNCMHFISNSGKFRVEVPTRTKLRPTDRRERACVSVRLCSSESAQTLLSCRLFFSSSSSSSSSSSDSQRVANHDDSSLITSLSRAPHEVQNSLNSGRNFRLPSFVADRSSESLALGRNGTFKLELELALQ